MASSNASEIGRIRCVQLLLKLGVDVNKANDQGWTPLMIAVANDRRSLVLLLLDRGALLGAANAQVVLAFEMVSKLVWGQVVQILCRRATHH